VPRQDDHGGAKPEPRRAHGKRRLQHQRGGHLVPASEMVLDQETRPEAQRLRLDGVVQIVAEALSRLSTKIAGAGLRRSEDSELHDFT
jgi:hypothetical protein